MKNKLVKWILCFATILIIMIGFCFYGNNFKTKYFVTKLETGQYGWVKKAYYVYRHHSIYKYNTYEEAQEAAEQYRDVIVEAKVIEETPLKESEILQ